VSVASHTSGTLTGVTTAAGEEAWRLLQQLLMNGEMQTRMRNACEAIGGPPSTVKTLFTLAPGEPIAMRDLAERFACDASYITELVDGLEEQGLATRQPHPSDRRVRTVVLTDKGAKARETVQQVMWQVPEVFSALTAAEQRQLRDLVRKMVDAETTAGADRAATG
jgi:DNA-binding MarR family transcriptional regulator